MMRTSPRSVVAVFALGALGASLITSGCLVGDLTDIPCARDDQCPTAHFCDIPASLCVADATGAGAPDLVVVGVRDAAGEVVIGPFVEPDVESRLAMVIENQGGRVANNVVVEMTELVCMNLVIDRATTPDDLAAGERVEVEFTVQPDLCSTPSIQDWFLFYSERAKRGTFNINILRQRPTGD